jgi:hypothetical protein
MTAKTTAQLGQQVEDHIDECAKNYLRVDARMGRIEAIMIAVAGGIIMTLLTTVVTLALTLMRPPAAPAGATPAEVTAIVRGR